MEPDRKPTTHNNHQPQKASHHHTQPDPGSYSWKLLLIKDARVHYVVLKQQPQTTHPTHTNAHVTGAARKPETNKPRKQPAPQPQYQPLPALLPQDPTVCQTLNHPSHTSTLPGTPTKEGTVLSTGKDRQPLFADIPPLSTRRRTIVCATGCTPDKPPHRIHGTRNL